MITIYIAAIIIGVEIILSTYLQTYIQRNKETPLGVVMIHGFLTAIGLLLLITYCLCNQTNPLVSTLILSFAGIGSFIMTYRDITGRGVPKWLGVAHGLTTIIGFGFLLWFILC